jgi:hypothetical protein
MPPRFAYWTIILDGTPTSFRMHERDEILPLFNQLKIKNPTALLKWFSGGKLWDSPEQAREERQLERVRQFREERKERAHEAHEAHGESEHGPGRGDGHGQREDPLAEFRRQHGRPADGSDDPSLRVGGGFAPRAGGPDRRESRGAPPRGPRSERGRDWRPGGEHKDPRDKYKLPPGEARKRWKERNLGPRGPKPFGGPPRGDRPFSNKPGGGRPIGGKPRGDRPFGGKPGGDRPFGDRPRGPKPFGQKSFGSKPFGGPPRGPKPFGSKPGGDRPFRGKPSGAGGPRPSGPRSFDHRPPHGPKPFRGKPRGPGRKGPK